ncbi:MAG: molybdopterin converting factor subunit 1 [Pseudomonadales bacterium]|nr:molybdopterin converting factor subunit 1 [Pseudomonadales bacterium]
MVKILYFARLRDQLSCAEEQFELAVGKSSIDEIKRQLAARGDPWSEVMQDMNLLVAVNQVIVEPTAIVEPGDEVGFFPPVTGG